MSQQIDGKIRTKAFYNELYSILMIKNFFSFGQFINYVPKPNEKNIETLSLNEKIILFQSKKLLNLLNPQFSSEDTNATQRGPINFNDTLPTKPLKCSSQYFTDLGINFFKSMIKTRAEFVRIGKNSNNDPLFI